METKNYKELNKFLEQELVFKNDKLITQLTKHDLMKLINGFMKFNKSLVTESVCPYCKQPTSANDKCVNIFCVNWLCKG